jgi:hypothetical protein
MPLSNGVMRSSPTVRLLKWPDGGAKAALEMKKEVGCEAD